MDVCPSCGESLNLVEDLGLRPPDETEAVPGGEKPVRPVARMVCSICSWPVDETRPDRHSVRSGAAGITTVNSPLTGPEAKRSRSPAAVPRTISSNCLVISRATTISVSPNT